MRNLKIKYAAYSTLLKTFSDSKILVVIEIPSFYILPYIEKLEKNQISYCNNIIDAKIIKYFDYILYYKVQISETLPLSILQIGDYKCFETFKFRITANYEIFNAQILSKLKSAKNYAVFMGTVKDEGNFEKIILFLKSKYIN